MRIGAGEQLRHGLVFAGIVIVIGGIVEFSSRRREARNREAEAKFFQDVQRLRQINALKQKEEQR
jgi:hypothetical protein